MTSDILRGYTDTMILSRLKEHDSYGYEINKELQKLSQGRFEMKEATLYTAFRRLESAGFIASYWGDEDQGARRRYYRLTDTGREKLQEELGAWEETRQMLDVLLKGNDAPCRKRFCGTVRKSMKILCDPA